MLKKLWNDESGAIVSAELILVATILVIGVITGLQAVRVAVVTELADVGGAIGRVNQSYSYTGVTGHHAFTAGSRSIDRVDTCDTRGIASERCLRICQGRRGSTPPTPEAGNQF